MKFANFFRKPFWIDLNLLVLHKHLLCFCNSYIYVSWLSNVPATRSIGMKFNFLQRQVLETPYKYLIYQELVSYMCRYYLLYFFSMKESNNIWNDYFNSEYNYDQEVSKASYIFVLWTANIFDWLLPPLYVYTYAYCFVF